MLNGVAYQMLGTLLEVLRRPVTLTVGSLTCDARERLSSVTMVIEPGGGGDLLVASEAELRIDQLKARSTGRPWTPREVIREALPDLYRAYCARPEVTRLRFVTEGRVPSASTFEALRERLCALLRSGAREIPQLAEHEQLLDDAVRQLEPAQHEAPGLFSRSRHRVASFLSRFEIVTEAAPDQWRESIERELLAWGIAREEVPNKLKELCGSLLEAGKQGNAPIRREDLLCRAKLAELPLFAWALVRERNRLASQEALRSRRFQPSWDARRTTGLLDELRWAGVFGPPVPAAGSPGAARVLVWGKSGIGKSWTLYRAAHDLVQFQDELSPCVVLIEASEDPSRDLAKAAQQFGERSWGNDLHLSLFRLGERIREVLPDIASRPWLVLFLDGVRDSAYLARLEQTGEIPAGVLIVAATREQPASETLESLSARWSSVEVDSFDLGELRAYLRTRLGEGARMPPDGVQQILRVPLFARLYCDLARSDPAWKPTREYQVLEQYWNRLPQDVAIARNRVAALAAEILRSQEYPWRIESLRLAGFTDDDLSKLEQCGLLVPTDNGTRREVWHDRILEWAMAEGLAAEVRERRFSSGQLLDRLHAAREGTNAAGRRFVYLLMDLVWLLAGSEDSAREALLEVVRANLDEHEFPELLATAGDRVVPVLEKILRAPDRTSSDAHFYAIETLERIGGESVRSLALKLLREAELTLQRDAVRLLEQCPDPAALERLWELYSAWSKAVEERESPGQGVSAADDTEPSHHDVYQADKTLQKCVRTGGAWLEKTILSADPAKEPVHTLVFLLQNTEDGAALWPRLRAVALQKVQPGEERCIANCMLSFWDTSSLEWLEDRAVNGLGLVGPAARKALTLLDPDRALLPLPAEPSWELATTRGWWLPYLRLARPAAADHLVTDAILGAADPWRATSILDGFEDWLTVEALDRLLDATQTRLEQELASPSPEDREPLYRPFHFLTQISRLDLLTTIQRSAGGPLEHNLVLWLQRRAPLDSGYRELAPEAGLELLRMIAGRGIAEVAATYLEQSSTWLGRKQGIDLALRRSNAGVLSLLRGITESPQIETERVSKPMPLSQIFALSALAAVGDRASVVAGVLRWGLKTLRDLDQALGERLHLEELAPAYAALEEPGESLPGALLCLGLSRDRALAPRILDVLETVPLNSTANLAGIVALEMLGDVSSRSEELFRRAAELPDDHGGIARRALLSVLHSEERAPAGVEELDRATFFDWLDWLLENPATQRSAVERWWREEGRKADHFRGDLLEHLAVLDSREIRAYLQEIAFSRRHHFWAGTRASAIRGLARLDPALGFEAARDLYESAGGKERRDAARLLLEVDATAGADLLLSALETEADQVMLRAIGEAFVACGLTETLIERGSTSPVARIREGFCFASYALPYSPDSDEILRRLAREEVWEVREAAWQAQEALRKDAEIRRGIEVLRHEQDLARRWSLLDTFLRSGYPGVTDGFGKHSWFTEVYPLLNASMRKHALEMLKKRREDLIREIERKERPE